MNRNKDLNHPDQELRKFMFLLDVDENVEMEKLRKHYLARIKCHHTDRGGNHETATELTQAFRVLKGYLEANLVLPVRGAFFTENGQSSSRSSYMRSGTRRNYQAPRAHANGYEEFGEDDDFMYASSHKNRNRRAKPNRFNVFAEAAKADEGISSESETENPLGRRKTIRFINGYQYDEEDYSTYMDPYEQTSRTSTENWREIRGGLVLRKDFMRNSMLSEEYEQFCKMNEDEILCSPLFEPFLVRLQNNSKTLHDFTEKMKVFVNLDWATARECHNQTMVRDVKIEQFTNGDDPTTSDKLYQVVLPFSAIKELDMFSAGLHVDVRPSFAGECRLYAPAVVDSVDVSERKLILFVLDMRIHSVLQLCKTVDLTMNASAFVFRSELRAIDFIQSREMDYIIFPSLKFNEPYEEFVTRRNATIGDIEFLESDEYNDDQKRAVYSILHRTHLPYPFVLFGPPGTGKTISLVESIRHIVRQNAQNRILVCTPSRMAADNFAKAVLEKDFLHPKYIFRMHSLSTSAIGRDKKLDPVIYLPKEGGKRFYGIPERTNLKMFRIIITTLSTSSYLTSAGGLRGFFTHIFMDEAGQATEADTWLPIGGLADRDTSVILAGDPRQLGPVVHLNISRSFGYEYSMLKRLIHSEPYEKADERAYVILKHTYRSHFKILRPCSYLFYDNMLQANEKDDGLYKLCDWEGLPQKGFPIIFHSSAGSQEEAGQGSNFSFSNAFELERVVAYVERIKMETDVEPKNIGVISPYKNQVIKLRQALKKYPQITIDSVEGFQGSEREVIIMSTVRTEHLGFLKCDLRLNTSISRAKKLLIVIGNDEILREHLSWKKFIFYCNFHGGYVDRNGKKSNVLELDR
ncbi:AAA domain-containing protein [Ditylenchus destructor]|uniref:AAA domain-containing protein n=1 Tax=Ditylenchus destructor TaxID=166010 RepID=A0AAD4NJF5_9BILA|nr:AAA domain-containing protein [Ditylenchus destructor]